MTKSLAGLLRNNGLILASAATLLLHLILLGLVFPLSQVVSGKPLFQIDNPYHLYQIELGRALLKQGLWVGYDPFFGAGYPGGVTFNASARFPVLMSPILPDGLPSEILYAIYVFICALIAPAAMVAMGRALRWPDLHTAFAVLTGFFFWWIGGLHWYHTAGMASYVCACYLGIAYAAWTWSICEGSGKRPLIQVVAAGLSGGLGMWLHPMFGLIPVVLFAALLTVNRERFSLPLAGRAAAIGVIAVTLNLPWLLHMNGAQMVASLQPYQRAVGLDVLLKPLLGIGGDPAGSLLNPMSALVGLSAVIFLDRIARKKILPFLIAGWTLLLFGAFGASIERLGALLQPNRFMAAGFLMLGLAAAFAAGQFALRFREDPRRDPFRLAIASIAVLALLFPAREIIREVSPGKHGHYGKAPPLLAETPAAISWLESWIKLNTSEDARILFETSLTRIHGGGHVAGYLAWKTGREFIGGAYPYTLPQLSFWDRFGFGGKIEELSEERFARGLEMYNVGWIVAHSEGLLRLAGGIKNIQPAAEFGGIHVFRVDRKLSYIQAGEGRIQSRDFNRVTVTDARGPALTLRYNWTPGLATEPPAQIVPEQATPDFPPQVKVINPPGRFDLRMRN